MDSTTLPMLGETTPIADALKDHETWLATDGREGKRASLTRSDLAGSDLSGADLRRADLSRADLKGANLQGARLAGASLPGASFEDADLVGADCRNADLRGAQFRGADLAGAVLHEADLRDADLSAARGLVGGQFGGANVAGAKLPDAILKFEGLANATEASKNLQNVFASLMLVCAYTWLTVVSTKDSQLVNNTAPAASRLPILGTDIPLVRFYLIVPLALVGLFAYFQLGLQHLWEELADLPAVFPDGRPLDRKSYPWLMNGLIRDHVARLRDGRSALDRGQVWLSILLAWGLVPITLLMIWGRYLSGHDWSGTCSTSPCWPGRSRWACGLLPPGRLDPAGRRAPPLPLARGPAATTGCSPSWLTLGTAAVFAVLSYGAVHGDQSPAGRLARSPARGASRGGSTPARGCLGPSSRSGSTPSRRWTTPTSRPSPPTGPARRSAPSRGPTSNAATSASPTPSAPSSSTPS